MNIYQKVLMIFSLITAMSAMSYSAFLSQRLIAAESEIETAKKYEEYWHREWYQCNEERYEYQIRSGR